MEPLERWQMVDRNTFAVVIDDKTMLGEFALSHFMRQIPMTVRQHLSSLRWDGDFRQGGVRWGRIHVTWHV